MTKHFNRQAEKEKRRDLRNEMTTPEVILWSKLKGRQVLNCKFRRQYSINAYVLDFYCPDLHLANEVDGEDHFTEEGKKRDAIRTTQLERFGVHVLRVPNHEVRTNLDGVLEFIYGSVLELIKGNPKGAARLERGRIPLEQQGFGQGPAC